MKSMADPDLSIIIPTYGRVDLLEKCLKSIFTNTKSLKLEIIVVDDALPNDVAVLKLKEMFPLIKLLKTPYNVGYGGAANLGMSIAKGRFIGVSNNDVELIDNSLLVLKNFLETHNDAGAVGPKLLNSDRTAQNSIFRKTCLFSIIVHAGVPEKLLYNPIALKILRLGAKQLRCELGSLGELPDVPRIVHNIMGAFFIVRREVLKVTQGFDSDNFYLFAEDTDWFLRIKKAGWKVYYVPDARIVHHRSQTLGRLNYKYLVQQYKSLLALFRKHFDKEQIFLFKYLLTFIFSIKLLFFAGLNVFSCRKILRYRQLAEAYCAIIRLFFDRRFRSQNVFREMKFRYIMK